MTAPDRRHSLAAWLLTLLLMAGMTAAFMVGSRLVYGNWPTWSEGADR